MEEQIQFETSTEEELSLNVSILENIISLTGRRSFKTNISDRKLDLLYVYTSRHILRRSGEHSILNGTDKSLSKLWDDIRQGQPTLCEGWTVIQVMFEIRRHMRGPTAGPSTQRYAPNAPFSLCRDYEVILDLPRLLQDQSPAIEHMAKSPKWTREQVC